MNLRSVQQMFGEESTATSGTPRIEQAPLARINEAHDHPERFAIIESCHSTWLFDTIGRQFCRVLRASAVPPSVATDWRDYDRLVVEEGTDAFIVFLDAPGTRVLRSWRHSPHCQHCGSDHTTELSLDDLRRVARA